MASFVFRDESDEKDDFDDRSESRLDENAADFGHFPCIFLTSETEQVRNGDHGDIRENENNKRVFRRCKVHNEGDRHNEPENVDVFSDIAAAAPGDLSEMFGVETAAIGFALGCYVRGNDMAKERRSFGRSVSLRIIYRSRHGEI